MLFLRADIDCFSSANRAATADASAERLGFFLMFSVLGEKSALFTPVFGVRPPAIGPGLGTGPGAAFVVLVADC